MNELTKLGFPGGSGSKESAYNAGDLSRIPGLGRAPGRGHGHPLQCSCLENPTDRGARRATVPGVTQSGTWLSDEDFQTFNVRCWSIRFRSKIGTTGSGRARTIPWWITGLTNWTSQLHKDVNDMWDLDTGWGRMQSREDTRPQGQGPTGRDSALNAWNTQTLPAWPTCQEGQFDICQLNPASSVEPPGASPFSCPPLPQDPELVRVTADFTEPSQGHCRLHTAEPSYMKNRGKGSNPKEH